MAMILVVDDERVFCDLLKTVLGSHGHEVFTAYNGREALDLFSQHRPQFTLLDLRMPEMNGIEVLRQIRTIDAGAAVMILTAWGSDALEKQARQLGVTDFLSKTLALDTIITSMERFLPPTTEEVQPPPPPPVHAKPPSPPAEKPKEKSVPSDHARPPSPPVEKPKAKSAPSKVPATNRIFLIESNTYVSKYLRQFLAQRGIHVEEVNDGPTALQLVSKEMPRLIVLNMDLQGMEGLEVMRELRAKKYTGGIIMLCSSEDETLLNLAIDMGSVDILGKPVDPERLAVAIQVGLLLGKV
jgi:DNA-binding response OmpR family regulator